MTQEGIKSVTVTVTNPDGSTTDWTTTLSPDGSWKAVIPEQAGTYKVAVTAESEIGPKTTVVWNQPLTVPEPEKL